MKDNAVSDDVYLVFTGDTFFAGETGRIDLYGEAEKENNAEHSTTAYITRSFP